VPSRSVAMRARAAFKVLGCREFLTEAGDYQPLGPWNPFV
jgi:hypothetical protein